MSLKQKQRGFTLVELLVVISIISLLSSVILASVTTTRQKASVASITSTLKNIIPQAELTYDADGNYLSVCSDPKVVSMVDSIKSFGGVAKCYSYDGKRWAVSARVLNDNTKNFSADSTGVVTFDVADLGYIVWYTAYSTSCAAAGGKLASIEQLKALYDTYDGNPPSSFHNDDGYWSSSSDPTDDNGALYLNMGAGNTGFIATDGKNVQGYIRCVH